MPQYAKLIVLLALLSRSAATAQTETPVVDSPVPAPFVPTTNPIRHPSASGNGLANAVGLNATARPLGTGQLEPPMPAAVPVATDPSGSRPQPEVAPAGITKETLRQRLQAVRESKDLAEDVEAELTSRYNKALEWLKSAEDAALKAAAYDAEIGQAGALMDKAKAELSASMPDPALDVPPDTAIPQLEQTLGEVETLMKSAQDDLAKREDEIKRRTERLTELAKLIADTKQRLDEAQKQTAAVTVDAGPASEAKSLEQAARLRALASQLLLLQTESRRYEVLAELFPLQRDVAKRVVAFREKEVAEWQQLVGRRRKEESQRQAREARRQVENAHPALRSLAERNAVLAELRQKFTGGIDRVSKERKTLNEQTTILKDDYEKIAEKVARARHSTSVGLMLRKLRDDLPERQGCSDRQRFIQREMPIVHLRLMELEEERGQLGDIESLADQVIANLDSSISQFDPAYVRQMVVELLQTKRDLLDKLLTDHDAYLKDLSELELANQTLIERIDQVRDYVDEHVLWIRSTARLAVTHFRGLLPVVTVLANPLHWIEVVKQTGADTFRQPQYAALIVVLGVSLFTLQRRLLGRLKTLCEGASRNGQLKFLPTLEGLLISALLSAQWPTLMLYVGWRLAASDTATDFTRAVAAGLINVAVLSWAAELIRQIMRAGGVAETHFNWPATTLRAVRTHLRWLTLPGLPLAFVTVFYLRFEEGRFAGSLGRIAFILGMLLLAGFFHILFYPKGRIFRGLQAADPGGWLVRFRHLVYGMSAMAPLVLTMLATVGYFYSAQQLALRIEYTVAVMLGLALVHAALSRWFLVKRRNLAIEQARQRRAEAQEAGSADPSQPAPVTQPERDLSKIHDQLRYLLRYAVTACILTAGWLIWSDVLPALRVLDRAVIWTNKVEVSETIEDASGKAVVDTYEKEVPTTLRHAMTAVLLIVVTYLLGRNLPALLEITVLDRLPIDHGGRHAVSMLVRYIVALTGVLLACRTMSIRWSSVQWLAAAMTVGLGFGLQEIFANLVSGIIILFERPIRVGDIVTVGTVTGTVSQMRMRATTVTDFDRRELIVPNKKFITDDVINWTLSDPISRVVLTVGIAYGSDTALAHSLLMKVAREHPIVLEEPEPSALFRGFGESTLDFDLRVFIPDRNVYPVVLHELNTAIDRAFRDAGIEIAFPQRDLNIRAFQQVLPFQSATSEPRADAA